MGAIEDTIRIRHMLDSANEAITFLGNTSLEEFRKNRMMANAIIRSLEVIGEAASHIAGDFKNLHNEIDWPVIIGMRNRLVHAYFDINFSIVWQTVHNDLPPLIDTLRLMLDK